MAYTIPGPSSSYAWEPGFLFLGFDNGKPVGIQTDRHAITIAGSRSGKGAGLIIPNLLRWPDNALVIDPKGENAEHSWEAREALGQSVHVLDPFRCANVPDRLRAAFNPFDLLDPSALTIREDIGIVADGLVLRRNERDGLWDDGAVSVLAGLIAHTLTAAPAADRNLLTLRGIFKLPADDLSGILKGMAGNATCGGLAQAASVIGLSDSKKNAEFWDGARQSTDWLDSVPMRDTLGRSTFNLADLKHGKATVYLVLPPAYIGEHGRFLRLFVKLAIDAMAKGHGRARCLFLLDEFHALGRLNEVSKAAGLLPSYGVHLWPFMQDLGQLQSLYDREGAETFFGNADAHIFFGNADGLTLEHVSRRLGNMTPEEAASPPPVFTHQATGVPLERPWFSFLVSERDLAAFHQNTIHLTGIDDANERARIEALNREAQGRYQHDMARAGKPRLAPDDVRELVAKKSGDAVARAMIAFAKGRDVFQLPVWPYFRPDPARVSPDAFGFRDDFSTSPASPTTYTLPKSRFWSWKRVTDIVAVLSILYIAYVLLRP